MANYINYEEAKIFVENIEDDFEKGFVSIGMAQVIKSDLQKEFDTEHCFDMLFFSKLLKKISKKKETLKALIEGKSLSWD